MKHIPNIITILRLLGTACCKIINQVSVLMAFRHFCFPHTKANKLAGLLLFLAVPTLFWSVVPMAFVAGVATFAAVQEGHFIRTHKV